jgi:hypothetical protein
MCTCIYCENAKLNLKSVKNDINLEIKDGISLINALVCDSNSFGCMNNTCEECSDFHRKLKELFRPESFEREVILRQWRTVNGFVKNISIPEKRVQDVIEMIGDSFEYFKLHKYLEKTQLQYFRDIKRTQGLDEAFIIEDFSEKFSAFSQNEIQSAYFTRVPISLFTAIVYVGQEKPISIVIFSDERSQNKEQVFTYNQKIIQYVKDLHPQVKKIRFGSDGCGGQFKNRFNFGNLLHGKEDFEAELEWHFTPTSHGKSAADGLGGTVKRNVRNQILGGHHVVGNALQMFTCAQSFVKNIQLFLVTPEEIKSNKSFLANRWENVKAIKDTRTFHSFVPCEDGKSLCASISSLNEGSQVFKLFK